MVLDLCVLLSLCTFMLKLQMMTETHICFD